MAEDQAQGRGGWIAGSGVISMRGARRARGRFAVLDDVQSYWDALRGDRLVPLRSEIDPRGIQGALDSAFIVERIATGLARFRLAGSFLVDLMGSEVRGMPLSVLFAADARDELAQAVEAVFTGPEVLRLQVAGERGLARPTLQGEMILLPLKSDLGDVSRALGCLATEGGIGRAPRRLSLRAMERTDILEGRSTRVGGASVEEARRPRLRPVPGAPHLSVVEGAD